MRSRTLPDHVNACAVSPDGKLLAYSGGRDNEISLGPLTAAEPVAALRGTGRRVWRVAFAKQEPLYRIAWGTEPRSRGFNDYADLDAAFDPTRLELEAGKLNADAVAVARLAGGQVERPAGGQREPCS